MDDDVFDLGGEREGGIDARLRGFVDVLMTRVRLCISS
jgi:hypothetical protein